MMVPKLENSTVSVLLVAITLILSWWIADKAHSHLPKANHGSSGIEGKNTALSPFCYFDFIQILDAIFYTSKVILIYNRICCQ